MAESAENASMTSTRERLIRARDYCLPRIPFQPELAFVLGSGLADFTGSLTTKAEIAFRDIPGFPVPTTADHPGKFVFAEYRGLPVVILQGRLHFYEGFSPEEVVLPIRLLNYFGVQSLILTNASGGIREDLNPGDFMLLEDHLSFLLPSPLRGPNQDDLGPRFPDMSAPYDPELNRLLHQAAEDCGIPLSDGIYIQTAGPQFETPAEIRCYRQWGADAVGMSTVTEVTAARHCGLRTACISCIGNKAAGISKTPLTLEEVIEASRKALPKLSRLLCNFIDLYLKNKAE